MKESLIFYLLLYFKMLATLKLKTHISAFFHKIKTIKSLEFLHQSLILTNFGFLILLYIFLIIIEICKCLLFLNKMVKQAGQQTQLRSQ